MDKTSETGATQERLPPSLRLLRGLVIALTATMIMGLIAIVALLVIRLPGTDGGTGGDLALPQGLKLPKGAEVQAITRGKGWIAVVTQGNKILIYDATTGALRHSYALD